MNPIYRLLISRTLNFDVKSFKFNNNLEICYKSLQIGVQAFKNSKLELLKSQGYEVVQLSENNLKVGYENLRKRLTEINVNIGIAASTSTIFSGVWLAISGSSFLESPVPMAALAIGGAVIMDHVTEAYHVKKYAKLSVLSNPIGPAISSEMNAKIQQIIAGSNPTVKLTRSGLEIIGPLGNLEYPSKIRENTILQIRSMNHITIPACVLGKHVEPLINNITKCWFSCLTLPFSFFQIGATLNKSSKNRSLADYVVAGYSVHNIYNYFHGESISEVRKKLSNYLEKGKTPQEILKLLIDGHDLQEGMNFLHPWSENVNTLGVRMGWTGKLSIYKNPTFIQGGAYPIQNFPQKNMNEEKEEEGHEKLSYALGALTIAGIAGIIGTSKKKKPIQS